MISTQEMVIRLLVALFTAGLIGLQRSLTGKVAGMRTHILVSMGAAIFTLISAYAFNTHLSQDRIAAQVVSGMGFIAGGVILKERGTIKGITTAAGLWAVAALGMAAGAGLYQLTFIGTGFALLTLVGLRLIEVHFPRRRLSSWEVQVQVSGHATSARIEAILASRGHRVWLLGLTLGEHTCITLGVETPRNFDFDEASSALRAEGVERVQWTSLGGPEE
jgi:putative Mg2+ transporter-C (MgtC) family protein